MKYDELKSLLELCDKYSGLINFNLIDVTTEILRLAKICSNNQCVVSREGLFFIATRNGNLFEWDGDRDRLRYSAEEIVNSFKSSKTLEEFSSRAELYIL